VSFVTPGCSIPIPNWATSDWPDSGLPQRKSRETGRELGDGIGMRNSCVYCIQNINRLCPFLCSYAVIYSGKIWLNSVSHCWPQILWWSREVFWGGSFFSRFFDKTPNQIFMHSGRRCGLVLVEAADQLCCLSLRTLYSIIIKSPHDHYRYNNWLHLYIIKKAVNIFTASFENAIFAIIRHYLAKFGRFAVRSFLK
jgi:hypothetical protein